MFQSRLTKSSFAKSSRTASSEFRLANRHAGQIGWVIGNGKSVQLHRLEMLKETISFGANRIYLAYPNLNWRPTYLCSADEQMIRDFGCEMARNHPGQVFFVSKDKLEVPGKNWTWLRSVGSTPLRFSEDVSKFVTPGGGTLIAAMQIGFSMGIKRFVLYGVDHSFEYQTNQQAKSRLEEAIGEDNHFISDYRTGRPWQPPVSWQAESSFLMSHVFLEARGGWVKNATSGGKLETLPRIDFDEALNLTQLNSQVIRLGV